MLKIGEFAGIAGLSVKALRHYDEKSVLVPAVVDDRSGYRLYAENQVRSGAIVRALRAAGVPLQSMVGVSDEQGALDVLELHREQVLAERLKEDQAYVAAGIELRGLAVPVQVETQRRDEQKYVGRILSLPADDAEARVDDEANAAFADLYGKLVGSGAQLTGRFWTTMRSGENGDIQLIGCWEVLSFPDPALLSETSVAGVLPARTDLVATWSPTAGEELPEGATHPAVVALFDAIHREQMLDERHTEVLGRQTEIRQTVLGHSESDYSVEVAVSLTQA